MKRIMWSVIIVLLWVMPVWAQDVDTGYQEALRRIEEVRVNGATELDLSSLGLTELPREIGQLTHLETLYLSDNQLTSLPPEIGQLRNLSSLTLVDNQLTSLPPEIGRLTRLWTLHLWGNQLTILPPEIGRLANLRTLSVATNQLRSLPSEIGRLSNLQALYLNNNQLRSLPSEIGELESLCYLNLSANLLDHLPSDFAQLNRLTGTPCHPQVRESLNLAGNPLLWPPPEITSQGTAVTLAYLCDYEAMQIRQIIAGIAAGVGAIAGVLLAFRWRQWRGLGEKKKRL